MNALNKFVKHNKNVELKKLKYGTTFKNYYDKNKYIFNEIYKEKLIPKDELVFLIKRILKHKSKFETSKPDILLKKIAEGFAKDHHELFTDFEEGDENTDDEYDGSKPKIYSNKKEDMTSKDIENNDQNVSENNEENTISNAALNTMEKIEEIKQDVKEIEQLKEHPDKKHIEEFNAKIQDLKEDIHKKFNDMIDAHMDLKKSIEEKRHLSNTDAKTRLENMEGKIEMLYGKQMDESMKSKKQHQRQHSLTKNDILKIYLQKKNF